MHMFCSSFETTSFLTRTTASGILLKENLYLVSTLLVLLLSHTGGRAHPAFSPGSVLLLFFSQTAYASAPHAHDVLHHLTSVSKTQLPPLDVTQHNPCHIACRRYIRKPAELPSVIVRSYPPADSRRQPARLGELVYCCCCLKPSDAVTSRPLAHHVSIFSPLPPQTCPWYGDKGVF